MKKKLLLVVFTVVISICTLGLMACNGDDSSGNTPPAHEHEFTNYVSNNDATYEKDGTETATCNHNGCNEKDTRTDVGSMLSHTHNYSTRITEPTCTTQGYTTYTCDCGDEYKDTYTNALGHSFTNYVSNNDATYDSDGTETATCNHNGCNEKDTRTDVGSMLKVNGITFKTLTVNNDNTVYGKVANGTTTFSFLNEIEKSGSADYGVYLDIYCNTDVKSKTVPLITGDNTFYILAENTDNGDILYTVTIRVKPVYTVSFNTLGGSAVASQSIEEDAFATIPLVTPTKIGTDFINWSLDFNQAITKDITVTPNWKVKEEMQAFDFTSTSTTCVITGVLDKTISEIIVPSYVTSIKKGAFSDCNSLTSISLPFVGASLNETTYTYFGYIFGANAYNYNYAPISLKKVIISDGLIIDEYAFYRCDNLTSIKIPPSVTSIGNNAFQGCSSLENISVDKNNANYSSQDGILYNKAKTEFIYIPKAISDKVSIPNTITGIGSYTFSSCSSLESIIIPDSVTSIGNYAFLDCTSLTSIIVPKSVTNIGNNAFYNCESLKSITITDGVYSIGEEAFRGCNSLTSIIIPNSIYSIGFSAFYGTSLKSITLPFIGATQNGTTNTYFGYIFGAEKFFENINFVPMSLKSVTITGSKIGENAFYQCISLTSVTICNSVTSIAKGAFTDCYKLVEIINKSSVKITAGSSAYGEITNYAKQVITDENASNIIKQDGYTFYNDKGTYFLVDYVGGGHLVLPNDINDSNYNIASYAFYMNKKIRSVVVPSGVIAIGNSAFGGCDSLERVRIGNSVTNIGSWAFYGCDALTSLSFEDASTWYYIDTENHNFTGGTQVSGILASYFTDMENYGLCNQYWYKI